MAERIISPGITVTSEPVPDANGWLPIETAPKDGTAILCWDGFSVFKGFFSGYSWLQCETLCGRPWTKAWQPLPLPPASPPRNQDKG